MSKEYYSVCFGHRYICWFSSGYALWLLVFSLKIPFGKERSVFGFCRPLIIRLRGR